MLTPPTISGKLFKTYLRSFSHPAKIRIQNKLGSLLFPKGIYLRNTDNTMLFLDPNDWITRVILEDGNYEPGSVALAKSITKNGGLFLDIGANFGLFTCQVANVNKAVRVVAVEPNYRIVGRLLENIRLNKLQERIKVFNIAISSKFELLSMQQPSPDNAGTNMTVAGNDGPLSILSCPLEFIYGQTGNVPIDLLKIDIEGNEFAVLKDFPFETKAIKNVIMEYNENAQVNFKELQYFFDQKGFDCLTIHGQKLTDINTDIPENNIWFANRITSS